MKRTCLFRHDWDGCICRRCGAKAHEHAGCHEWELTGTEKMGCSMLSSRGSGQYLDACYGMDCAFCGEGKTESIYVCKRCGKVKREPAW